MQIFAYFLARCRSLQMQKQEQKYVYIHLASSSNYYSKLIRIKNLNFLHRNQHYFHGNNRPFATSRHYSFLLTSKSYQNRRMRIKDFHTSYISERPCRMHSRTRVYKKIHAFVHPFDQVYAYAQDQDYAHEHAHANVQTRQTEYNIELGNINQSMPQPMMMQKRH